MKIQCSLAVLVALSAGLTACRAVDNTVRVGAPGSAGTGFGGTGGSAGTGLGAAGQAGGGGTSTVPTAGFGGVAGSGTAGAPAQAGAGGSAGAAGAAGASTDAGTQADAAGTTDAGSGTSSDPEPGRLKGILAAHNKVRADASNPTPNPALPALTWSTQLATTAQAYADKLAAACSNTLMHSMTPGLGENLAASFGGLMTAQGAVDGWAAEKACWTYGNFGQTDSCNAQCAAALFSNGCGHYTQLVWRDTTQLGCGAASCGTGQGLKDFWVCNYSPEGNIIYQPNSKPPY